ncbi:hypothetical protein CKAN_02754200 [Cinnamomum micranthum f. kanehirae]|uniref:Uncharacterized protein n=1 Tax=Cinnamomum micranthum f. kanehirae TaxID=337451 RepID=A0A3S3RCY2_9MAGN|nr:hypothetical protein CKAN_02735000 [Cinnamomum micranthum f. kanehirae]RWR98051.1 hypothetical protein CKAN_02754200 [Cinnamomum micranthum f. kanehirae]
MDCGRCSIRSWQEFQAELKAQFMPGNVSWMARQALFNLKPVRCEMNGAQAELRRQNVVDLDAALAAADRLIDLKYVGSSSRD